MEVRVGAKPGIWPVLLLSLVVLAFGLAFLMRHDVRGLAQEADPCVNRCLKRGFEPDGRSRYRPEWCRCDMTKDVFDPDEPDDIEELPVPDVDAVPFDPEP